MNQPEVQAWSVLGGHKQKNLANLYQVRVAPWVVCGEPMLPSTLQQDVCCSFKPLLY
jgi:hypothetical protein